jgi:hypothetical protein
VSRNSTAAVNYYSEKMRPAGLSENATFEQVIAAIDEIEAVSTTISPTVKKNGSSMENASKADA